jgi:uncharacterized protein (DUF1330 family)
MAGYVIADIEVTDPVGYEEYKKLSGASVAAYGGSFLVRGGATETLEGEWNPKRFVVLRFESTDRAREWYASKEYAPAKAIRLRTARSTFLIAEGS